LLDWMVSAPSNRIRDFELLSPIEKKRVLTDWTGTAVKFDRELCIHQLIERQAGNNPDAPAVAFEHRVMTYRELDQYANQLAHYLRAQGIGPGMLVGIFMERTPDMIVALLGVLKAGAAYLPLDLTYPEERLKFICQDAHPKLILSQQYIHVSPPEIENVPLFNLDTDWDALASFYTTHKPINLSNPNHLAYVLFTSGTTGRPKGVALPHRSALGLVEWIRRTFSAQELSGVLASTSIGFDMSVFEILGTLALGGCMILVDNILDILAYHGTYPITLINTVPSAVAELLNTTRIPSSVSTIVLAGEPLSTQLVDNLYQVPGIQRIYDAYGPTETSYSTQCLRKAGNRPTIGKPLSGWKVYILDDDLHLLPVGIPGEIYIGGIGIADGYYGHPELTCERFLINPYGDDPLERFYRTGDLARWLADGNIEYIGRMDHQVKIRGFRVELAEVENTLSLHPSVGQAVVVTREDHPGDKRLVAYIIPIIKKKDLSSAKTNLESEKLRGFLREKLPNYMIPSAFVQMDAFPLTASGKIDRKALPPPGLDIIDTQSYIPPINQTEHGLSNIWMDVLKLPRISREDNFFDLGGNSLSALQVMARILETFEINMPIKWIFEFPRLSDLANRVDFVLHYKKQSLYSEEGMNNREDFAL